MDNCCRPKAVIQVAQKQSLGNFDSNEQLHAVLEVVRFWNDVPRM